MTQIIINPDRKSSRLMQLVKYSFISMSLVVGVLFAILAGAANPILNAYLDDLNRTWSESIGGELKIKRMNASVFPWFVFELEDLELDKLLSVKSVALEFDTFRALISQGEHINIDRALIDGADIRLVKYQTGVWNFESYKTETKEPSDLAFNEVKQEAALPKKTEANTSDNPQNLESLLQSLQALKIGTVYLKNLRVSIEDKSQEPTKSLQLVELDWEFSTFEPARELKTRLKAKVLNQTKTLSLEVHLGPYGDYLTSLSQQTNKHELMSFDMMDSIDPPFPIEIKVESDEIDFAPLKSLLPSQIKHLAQVKTEGQLKLLLEPHEDIVFKGDWFVRQLQLEAKSFPFNLQLAPQVSFNINPKEQSISLSLGQSHISINDMRLAMNGQVFKNPKELNLVALSVQGQGFSFEKLSHIIPQINKALPPNSELRGPIEFKLSASGDAQAPQASLRLDLAKAKISIPETFYKAVKDPLGLNADILFQTQKLKVKNFEFYLGQAKLVSSGIFEPLKQKIQLSLDTDLQGLSLSELSRHIPQVEQELNRTQAKVKGELSFESHLSARILESNMEIDLESALSVSSAQLNTDALRINGNGGVKLDFKQQGNDLLVLLDSNLTSLDLKFGDVFHKSNQQAFDIEFELSKKANNLTVPQFNFQLADLKLRGIAKQYKGRYELNAQLKSSPLKSFLAMFGAGKTLGPDLCEGKLGFMLKLTAGNQPDDVQIKLSKLRFKAPKNDLRAELDIQSPESPRIQFQLTAPKFDLDQLVPASPAKQTGVTSEQSESSLNSSQTQKYSLQGTVLVKRGQARGIKFKNLDFRLRATEKGLEITNAFLEVFGGSMQFAPLKINLKVNMLNDWNGQLKLDKIQLAQAQKTLFSISNLSGKLSGNLNLEGQGQEWKTVSNSLIGNGAIKLENAKVPSFDLNNALLKSIGNAIKAKVKAYQVPKLKSRAFKLRKFEEKVSFKAGQLNFKDEMETKLNKSPLSLKGGLGLDGTLAFDAELLMSSKQVSSWLKIPIKQAQTFPIKFKLGGDLHKPTIKNISALSLLTAAGLAYGLSKLNNTEVGKHLMQSVDTLKKQGKNIRKKAEKKVSELKTKAKKQLTEVKAKAKQEAQQKLDEAKNKLDEESKKLKRKAQKAKKRTEKKAKQKAKQKAKDTLKGLF